MDWNVDDKPPMMLGLALEVWMANGNVRKVVFDQWFGFRFTDCTQPWQNVFCSPDYIKGWRENTVEKPLEVCRNMVYHGSSINSPCW